MLHMSQSQWLLQSIQSSRQSFQNGISLSDAKKIARLSDLTTSSAELRIKTSVLMEPQGSVSVRTRNSFTHAFTHIVFHFILKTIYTKVLKVVFFNAKYVIRLVILHLNGECCYAFDMLYMLSGIYGVFTDRQGAPEQKTHKRCSSNALKHSHKHYSRDEVQTRQMNVKLWSTSLFV